MRLTPAVLALAAAVSAAVGPVAEKRSLSLDGAKKVIAAAVAEARKLNAPGGAIAVVDDGGNLIAVERLDGTFAAGPNISIGKARTAAMFQRPTKLFEDIIAKGRTSMVAVSEVTTFTPLQGGVPILSGGKVIGAIGVSGAASAQQDEDIAKAGAGALDGMMTSAAVTYLDNSKVAAAFAKGTPLLEVGDYKVHASRREAPGTAEVHERDTDIIYVLEGSATFVTGGTVSDGKTTAPEEIRGASIRSGETRRIAKGDFLIVPHGTPHWFKEVSGPMTYYVVKVPTGGSR